MKQNVSTANRTLFMDHTVLELDHIPETIRFRETQINTMYQNIRPAIRGACPTNMILQGLPGTGKTTIVKHIFKEIKETNIHILPVLVNCQIMQTEFRVFHKIYSTLFHQEPPLHGVSIMQLIDAVATKFSRTGDVILICLDDVNFLLHENTMEKVLCTLLRLHEEYPGIKIGVIITVNTIDAPITNHLSKSVNSIFRPNLILFPPYEEEEVRAIMQDRVRVGLCPGIISPDIQDTIVEKTMKECDLRLGICLLKSSADLAESDNRTSITQTDVGASLQTVREIHLQTADKVLKEEEQQMLDMTIKLIRQNGNRMNSGELYQEMEKLVPMCYSSFRRRINKYSYLGLIKINRPNIWGNTREILLRYDTHTIKK